MKLTKEEIEEIDAALEKLKLSLKDELMGTSGQKKYQKLDETFIKKIADSYLSTAGILSLLEDSHFLTEDAQFRTEESRIMRDCGGPCHVTCVNPAKTACWNAGSIL